MAPGSIKSLKSRQVSTFRPGGNHSSDTKLHPEEPSIVQTFPKIVWKYKLSEISEFTSLQGFGIQAFVYDI